ncbi:hypothetical protein RFI_15082 [Reticulomyxa filosa]|uniref:Uncharacterized protein n=1 Tax=Reticulomyxa filosa TaxID=46433 RepID=X6N762_RETFI|nr:hypothetical protein RFI_15082 [Reticulomyxa filosa]|eukprot:ETO22120.1 hypothetical protein RFI_15082 [Reticulomyxa filosa]
MKQLAQTDKVSLRVQVSMHYFDPNDQTEIVKGETRDKFVPANQLRPTKIYGCRAIITNGSSAQMNNLETLYQIPTGSIPMNNSRWTLTEFRSISSYSIEIIEFYFYFPTTGKFRHFPVQISRGGEILGVASNVSEIVVSIPQEQKTVNEENWLEVAASGDLNTVVKYLSQNSISNTNLREIYYYLRDAKWYRAIVDLLSSKQYFDSSVWRYSLVHRNLKDLSDFITFNSASLADNIWKPSFFSDWFNYDEWDDHKDTYLEYFPLINARSHPLGTQKKILNDGLLRTYQKFLRRVAFQSGALKDMSWVQKLQACYYLLLQDRVTEAVLLFKEYIDKPKEHATLMKEYQVLYDYVKAYLSLFDEGDATCSQARDIARKWKDDSTLPLNKQKLFDDIIYQVNELTFDNNNNNKRDEEKKEVEKMDEVNEAVLGERNRRMDAEANAQPSIAFEIENRRLVFNVMQIEKVAVNFYKMDIELLFSMSPFLEKDRIGDSVNVFSFIQPNETIDVNFTSNNDASTFITTHQVELPKSLWHGNMYCEVVVKSPSKFMSTRSLCQPFYDNRLLVQIKENFGQLKTLDKETKKPLRKCYVKVYGLVDGAPKFHKDGYTDRRGVFDYVNVSCDHLTRTTKFAILVHSKDCGSLVETVNVPL